MANLTIFGLIEKANTLEFNIKSTQREVQEIDKYQLNPMIITLSKILKNEEAQLKIISASLEAMAHNEDEIIKDYGHLSEIIEYSVESYINLVNQILPNTSNITSHGNYINQDYCVIIIFISLYFELHN